MNRKTQITIAIVIASYFGIRMAVSLIFNV